jgi:hypothetical protein
MLARSISNLAAQNSALLRCSGRGTALFSPAGTTSTDSYPATTGQPSPETRHVDRVLLRSAPVGPSEALNSALRELSASVTAAIRELLEKKHLYQRVRVFPEKVASDVFGKVTGPRQAAQSARERFTEVVSSSWKALPDFADFRPEGEGRFLEFKFKVPHVKLFCSRCDAVHAFNPVAETSGPWSTAVWEVRVQDTPAGDPVQHFALPFQCQSCRATPEVFLIRREGSVLLLCGRAPIETVQVPRDIPTALRKFYSNAVVAHQSGQTLSGNFQLRTLIEQFAAQFLREVPSEAERRAEAALDAYMATLPDDFKARFPSLRQLYGDLSADIHTATGSADLFESSKNTLEEHFEARRVFKVPGPAEGV